MIAPLFCPQSLDNLFSITNGIIRYDSIKLSPNNPITIDSGLYILIRTHYGYCHLNWMGIFAVTGYQNSSEIHQNEFRAISNIIPDYVIAEEYKVYYNPVTRQIKKGGSSVTDFRLIKIK